MDTSDITLLRQLILNLDKDELDKLKKLLNYPNDLAIEISKILPEAVLFSIHDSDKLATALIPMIETVITRSVAQNPKLLADALYPVIGRSIRKSINEEFKKLLQTFNELIENTFSIQSLKWRYQAIVTGRKYSEVVISNTIKYKAEHVFLIHRETGLLLSEVHEEMSHSADPDTISGMLKAITDFVHDSFQDTSNSELNLIEMEGYQVLIEQGPHAILASIVKGFTLDEYRNILSNTLEEIHNNYAASLADFIGDTFIFDTSRDLLMKCLKTEKKDEFSTHKSRIGVYVAIPILAVLFFFLGQLVYYNMHWRKYINTLEQSENILLAQHGKYKRAYFVNGMLLPGATHPDSLLSEFKFPQKRLQSYWHLYVPANQQTIYSFIQNEIGIPQKLNMSIENDTVILSGVASQEWFILYEKFLLDKLTWFQSDTNGLRLVTQSSVKLLINEFIQTHLYFKLGMNELTQESEEIFNEYVQKIKTINAEADVINRNIKIRINGYADRNGDEDYNRTLSLNRANFIVTKLIEEGIPKNQIIAIGKGTFKTDNSLTADQQRRVDFEIEID